MIDTHAHLVEDCYADRLDEIVGDMHKFGLTKIFTASYDYQSIIGSIKIAEKYDDVYAIIGVHPENCTEFDRCKDLMVSLCSHPKVVGIGEIGLDYHYAGYDKTQQKLVFVEQIKLAYNAKLPIQIHVRDAIGDLIEVLKENQKYLKYGVLIHCFSESVEVFEVLKKLGCKVAFGGVSTFKNARKVKEVILKAELSDFVVETDCPYLTPEPMRGKMLNEPRLIVHTLNNIATLKGMSPEDIDMATTNNALQLFPKAK